MKTVIQTFITGALAVTMLSAQGFPPHGNGGQPPDPATMVEMRVNMLATRLSLTDAQKAQATTIYTQSNSSATTLRTNARTIQQSLSDAVRKNDVNSIDSLSANLGTLEGQIMAIDRKADAAFYAILTPDQQTKYSQRPAGGPGGGMMGRGRFGADR